MITTIIIKLQAIVASLRTQQLVRLSAKQLALVEVDKKHIEQAKKAKELVSKAYIASLEAIESADEKRADLVQAKWDSARVQEQLLLENK
jgi:hypothetical protein